MNLYKRDVIRFIEERYGFKTKKVLGQNFLVDKAVIDSIVDGSFVDDTCLAIEIGPGIGVITHELCMKARKVVSIELDKTLIPILEDTLKEFDNFRVINEDVLKVDFEALIKEEMEKDPEIKHVKVIGNLPYYITTPIIMKLFENIKEFYELIGDTVPAELLGELEALEAILYGTEPSEGNDGTDPRLPLPAEVITVLGGAIAG